MGRSDRSLIYGFDESGISPMMCALVISRNIEDAHRYVDENSDGLIEKRYNKRFFEKWEEVPDHVENGGGYLRRVVEDNLPQLFMYAGLPGNNRPPPNEYRIKVIANLLRSGGVRKQDMVYIDAFNKPTKIVRDLLRELSALGIQIPEDHIICEYHADEIYPIVNDADFVANTLYHSRSGEFRDHRVRIDLRTHKKAA